MAVDIIARALAAKARELAESGSGSGGTFDTAGVTTYEVGGIPAGTNLEGKTWQQIFTMMLYGGAAVPVLTAPSLSVVLDNQYAQVGENVSVSGVATFNRGSISPAYGTSGFRSGLPNSYVVNNGEPFATTTLSYRFTAVMNIQEGDNQVSVTVSYDAGEQPKDGSGNDYDAPLPAGAITATATITGTYPVLIRSSDGTYEAQDINTQFDENGMIELEVPAEVEEDIKQSIAFSTSGVSTILGVQQYDPSRDLWDWIYGTPAESLTSFDNETSEIPVAGTSVEYEVYTNSTVKIGARKLRFYTQLPTEN